MAEYRARLKFSWFYKGVFVSGVIICILGFLGMFYMAGHWDRVLLDPSSETWSDLQYWIYGMLSAMSMFVGKALAKFGDFAYEIQNRWILDFEDEAEDLF